MINIDPTFSISASRSLNHPVLKTPTKPKNFRLRERSNYRLPEMLKTSRDNTMKEMVDRPEYRTFNVNKVTGSLVSNEIVSILRKADNRMPQRGLSVMSDDRHNSTLQNVKNQKYGKKVRSRTLKGAEAHIYRKSLFGRDKDSEVLE